MAEPHDVFSTIDYRSRLEILDGGKVAIFSRSQTLRIQNLRGCFIDRIWGDGVLIAEYAAQGLELFDSVRGSKGYSLLLGFSPSLAVGDVVRIETRRKIIGAFHEPASYWELAMPGPTQRLTLDVIAPTGFPMRLPHLSAPSFVGVDAIEGPRRLRIQVKSPEPYVPYRVDWSW